MDSQARMCYSWRPSCPVEPGTTTVTYTKHEATTWTLLVKTVQNPYIRHQTETLWQGGSPPELSSLGDPSGPLGFGLGEKMKG